MSDPKLKITQRNLPHWTSEGSTYFITFRICAAPLTDLERQFVIDHLCAGHGQFYFLAAAVVLPDHAHLLLRPLPGISLPRILKGIKGVSAKRINLTRRTSGSLWQDESWDRIVRDAAEFQEKLQYMADNPIKAGLAMNLESYVGWYCFGESL